MPFSFKTCFGQSVVAKRNMQ